MAQVVDVDKDFVLQLRILDDRYRAVLVDGAHVRLQSRSEVRQMRRYPLDHVAPAIVCRDNKSIQINYKVFILLGFGLQLTERLPHLSIPNHFRGVKLSQKHLRKFFCLIIF